jgi:predicted tellurium resistance membrane protein TerC
MAMIWLGKRIGDFVLRHPTVKMLALSFLLLIGVSLASEGLHTVFGAALSKGYIYSAMAFSVFVEVLNLTAKKRREKKRGVHRPEAVHLKRNVVGFRSSASGGS